MMLYRHYTKLRTMRQKKGEFLHQYTTKFQQYVFKAGIPNNEELVFNHLCSLNGRYRCESWQIVHNNMSAVEMPNELEPVIQLVLTQLVGEKAPEDEQYSTNCSFASGDSDSDSDDDTSSRHSRKHSRANGKRNKNKKSGKENIWSRMSHSS
ncbi:hypothetical protein LRAMOSA02300 [Lichtheimia ramosa]|uniref:Retrotransposon gag domain-containing protein n=1 Tax=Lichtheimia ramosa TaxID=688394 RepID=A0A077WNM7_9FUNG|nr:hypothetical protein LRAMOSA02300 [Lichtheimia ramosa]